MKIKTPSLLLVGALALAACDTAPKLPSVEAPTKETELPPVTGGTINKPEGSTAAEEFVIKGDRAKQLAQALGFRERANAIEGRPDVRNDAAPLGLGDTSTVGVQNVMAQSGTLRPQAGEDELRVLVTVSRAKSGENVGKKKGSAVFVWGNQKERLSFDPDDLGKNVKPVRLKLTTKAGVALDTNESTLNLKVKYPDFQDKATKTTRLVPDSGVMCASVTFDLKTFLEDGAYGTWTFDNTTAPLEVCEGQGERLAEKVALEKASDGLTFKEAGSLPMPFTWAQFDDQKALPDGAALASLANLPAGTTVTTQSLTEFFAPLVKIAGDSEAVALARKFETLKKQFGVYYRETRVYRAKVAPDRTIVFVLGLNGWGIGGLKTQILAQ